MRFSVITVCLNNLEGLKKTHNSLEMQTYINFEWIVVDGGSVDGTLAFLEKIKQSSTHMRFVSEPDKGLYDAMNKGIRMARGDYLVFMNSGDMFAMDDTLAHVSAVIEKNPETVFIYGDSLDVDSEGKLYHRKARNHQEIYRGMITQHQSMFFARFEGEQKLFYSDKYRYSSDYDYIIRYLNLCKNKESIIHIREPLSRFQLGGLNETRRFKAIREDFLIRKRQLNMGWMQNTILMGAHFLHTHLKRLFPGLMKKVRYSPVEKGMS